MGAGFFVADGDFDDAPPGENGTPSENLSQQNFFWEFETFSQPGPTGPEEKSLSVVGDIPADKNLLNHEITPEKIRLLLRRTEVARQRVNQEIDSIQLAQELLDVIRSGKTLLLAGAEHFDEAERMFNEVEYRLAYNKRVKFWSGSFAFKLLWYEIGCLFILGIGAFIFPPILSGFMSGEFALLPIRVPAFVNPDDVYTLVSTMIWGGLGGVVGAMYSLWRHVSVKQDFNPQHSIWYITQPLMGMPIGAFIFIALRIGIILTYDQTINIQNPFIIYIIAWIAGFQQNVVYEIVRQIIKLFRIERSSNPVSAPR
jgi:ABC-type multidrug transport system fused ATPase/permease subunit